MPPHLASPIACTNTFADDIPKSAAEAPRASRHAQLQFVRYRCWQRPPPVLPLSAPFRGRDPPPTPLVLAFCVSTVTAPTLTQLESFVCYSHAPAPRPMPSACSFATRRPVPFMQELARSIIASSLIWNGATWKIPATPMSAKCVVIIGVPAVLLPGGCGVGEAGATCRLRSR